MLLFLKVIALLEYIGQPKLVMILSHMYIVQYSPYYAGIMPDAFKYLFILCYIARYKFAKSWDTVFLASYIASHSLATYFFLNLVFYFFYFFLFNSIKSWIEKHPENGFTVALTLSLIIIKSVHVGVWGTYVIHLLVYIFCK